MSNSSSSSSQDSTIVDGSSMFAASEIISDRQGTKVTLDYPKLKACLDTVRKDRHWRPAGITAAILSLDPNSEGQQRFSNMLRHSGFEPDIVHYRDTFVSQPPGHGLPETGSKPLVSLAGRIGYIAGLMTRYKDPHFIVVTHAFEICGPLADLARRAPHGHIALAYFGSLLDYRWRLAGLMDRKIGVEWIDLDPYGEELVGSTLVAPTSGPATDRNGLARF